MPSMKKSGAQPKTLAERLRAAARKAAKARAAREAKAVARAPAAYRPAIVTFIDILGFRELVKKASAAEIDEILSELRDWSRGDREDLEEDDHDWPAGLARSIAFSDNIVRASPVDGDHGGEGALFHELLSLVHIQAKLTERGIFLRGGLTVADIYMAGNVVFGPGLVRAYELESQFAIYPRIIVDPAVMEHYFKNPTMRGDHSVKEDLEYVTRMLREGDDGLFYVDYLKACRSELNDPNTGFTLKLKQHAGHIAKAAAAFDQFTTAKQKYAWLARYHNIVVDETDDADDGCKVDEMALMYPEFASAQPKPQASPKSAKTPKKAARKGKKSSAQKPKAR